MIRRTFFAMMMSICTASSWAADPQAGSASAPAANTRPVYGALNAAQLNQVQLVSRAVPAAKGNLRPTAEEEALLTELHGLADSVEQVLQLNGGTASMSITPAGTISPNADTQSARSRASKLNNLLNPQIARLHERRTAIDNLSTTGDETRQAEVAHVQRLSQQVGALEQLAQAALATSDDAERYVRLSNLRKQLHPRSLAEWWQDRDAEAVETGAAPVAPTPTMTTLTQHRLGLDDLRAGKR